MTYRYISDKASIRLYIPFWLYSNGKLDNFDAFDEALYIPFWLYSNGERMAEKLRFLRTLHSILVIF